MNFQHWIRWFDSCCGQVWGIFKRPPFLQQTRWITSGNLLFWYGLCPIRLQRKVFKKLKLLYNIFEKIYQGWRFPISIPQMTTHHFWQKIYFPSETLEPSSWWEGFHHRYNNNFCEYLLLNRNLLSWSVWLKQNTLDSQNVDIISWLIFNGITFLDEGWIEVNIQFLAAKSRCTNFIFSR